MYQGLTANTSQDLTRLLGFQSITYKPLALPSFIMFLIQAKIAWQANSNHAGHAAHDPAWDSWRFRWGTHLEASEYMRQSTAFLYHSVTTSCGACPCSPDQSILVCFGPWSCRENGNEQLDSCPRSFQDNEVWLGFLMARIQESASYTDFFQSSRKRKDVSWQCLGHFTFLSSPLQIVDTFDRLLLPAGFEAVLTLSCEKQHRRRPARKLDDCRSRWGSESFHLGQRPVSVIFFGNHLKWIQVDHHLCDFNRRHDVTPERGRILKWRRFWDISKHYLTLPVPNIQHLILPVPDPACPQRALLAMSSWLSNWVRGERW